MKCVSSAFLNLLPNFEHLAIQEDKRRYFETNFDPKQTACSIYNFMIFFPRFFRFIFLFFVLVESIKVRIFLNIL